MQIITNTAQAHGCSAEIDWMEEAHPYYPPTINSADLASFVKDVGARSASRPPPNAALVIAFAET